MVQNAATQQVEVTFIGTPPARQIQQALGVSGVQIDGQIIRCLICGSFQPFLEAVRGYEVLNLTATPTQDGESA